LIEVKNEISIDYKKIIKTSDIINVKHIKIYYKL